MIRSEFKRFYLSKPCLGEGCSRRVVGSFLLALLLMGIGNITLADGILGTVKEKFQELDNWCWDGSTQSILEHYNVITPQCDIADYAWDRTDCCSIKSFASGHACNRGNYLAGWGGDWWNSRGIKEALKNFGNVESTHIYGVTRQATPWGPMGWYGHLTKKEIETEIDDSHPFVIAWYWNGGGGHAMVGRGIQGDNVYYMDPWPGNGYTITAYSGMVDSWRHYWGQTLTTYRKDYQITMNAVGCGSISPPKGYPTTNQVTWVPSNDTPAFGFSPSSGLRVKEVWLDYEDPDPANRKWLGAPSSYTFDPVKSDHSLTAFFELANRKSYASLSVPGRDSQLLGESWSRPLILAIPYGGKMSSVAVYGAGFNSAIDPDYGAAVYVLDLKDGAILEQIKLDDGSGSNGVVNAVPANVIAITRETTDVANYKGAMVYVTDLEGRVWKINMTDQGKLFDKTILFDAETTATNERLSFHPIKASTSGGSCRSLWLYLGTGDIRSRQMESVSGAIDNHVYGIKDVDFPLFKKRSKPLKKIDLNASSKTCVDACDPNYHGWYKRLKAGEKVTGEVAVAGGWIYYSTFRPNSKNACSIGTGYLTIMNMVCPKGSGTNDQAVEIEVGQGVPTAPSVGKKRIYVGISNPEKTSNLDKKIKGARSNDLGIEIPSAAPLIGATDVNSWRVVK